MLNLIVAISFVIGGCIWNGFELEKVVAHPAGGKQFGLGLTLVQCVLISVVAFVHFAVLRLWEIAFTTKKEKHSTSSQASAFDGRSPSSSVSRADKEQEAGNNNNRRPLFTLNLRSAVFVAFLFWLTNCINNYVFKFGIAVPIQQLVRSSSLLSSAVTGFWFDGKRFSPWQTFHLVVITAGIAVLSIVGTHASTHHLSSSLCGSNAAAGCSSTTTTISSSSSSNSSSYRLFPDPNDAAAVVSWITGVCLLLVSAFLATFLGMAQTNMYRSTDAITPGASKQPAVTEEAIFLSHFLSVGFFAVYYGVLSVFVGTENPVALFVFKMPPDLQRHILFNCLSQYACIWGVFALARSAPDAFLVTMATTVRKFISLTLSILWFGHARQMTVEQSVAICAVAVSVTLYPFLKSPAPAVVDVPVVDNKKSKSKKRKRD